MTDEFATAVANAADTIATTLAAAPPRAGRPYPIGELLPPLIAAHESLREAVEALPESPALHPLGEEVAMLMSLLQLVRVLYRHPDDVPQALRPVANRNLSTTQLWARRLRDRARRTTPRGHRS